MDIEFKSVGELYERLIPALATKEYELKRNGYSYDEISKVVSGLNPNALTIGFARRFATVSAVD